MTNKEKAKILVGYEIDTPRSLMKLEARDEYDNLISMAEWKDSQIREIIDEEIGRANLYHDKQLSRTQISASVRVVSVLCDYLGEEFPKDKFHFDLAMMDYNLPEILRL